MSGSEKSFDALEASVAAESTANSIRVALQAGASVTCDAGFRRDVQTAATHLSVASTSLLRPSSSAANSSGGQLALLKCALSCTRLLRNACAVGSEARMAVVAAGAVDAAVTLLSFLSKDCLLRAQMEGGDSELAAALKELNLATEGAASGGGSANSAAGIADEAGWASTAKLAVKASWQLLSNSVTSLLASAAAGQAEDGSRATIASNLLSWLLQAAGSSLASPACYLHEALLAWCREDGSLLSIVGWLVYHVMAFLLDPSRSLDAADAFFDSSGLLRTLLSLAGAAPTGPQQQQPQRGEPAAAAALSMDWLLHLIGLFRSSSVVAKAYSSLTPAPVIIESTEDGKIEGGGGGDASDTSLGAFGEATSPVSSQRKKAYRDSGFVVTFEQLVFLRALSAELEEAREEVKSLSAASSPASSSSSLPSLSEKDAELFWQEVTRLSKWLVDERKKQVAAAAAATAEPASGSSGVSGVASSVAQRALILLCGLLADHEAEKHDHERSAGEAAVAAATDERKASLISLSHALAVYHRPVHRQQGRRIKGAGAGAGGHEQDDETSSLFVLNGAVDCFRLLSVCLTAAAMTTEGTQQQQQQQQQPVTDSLAEAIAVDCPALVPLLYYHSQKMEEEKPTLREWAVLGLKAMLGSSEKAAEAMKELDRTLREQAAAAAASSAATSSTTTEVEEGERKES